MKITDWLWAQKNRFAKGDVNNKTSEPLVVLAGGTPYILPAGTDSKRHPSLANQDVDAVIPWRAVKDGKIYPDTPTYKLTDPTSLAITRQNHTPDGAPSGDGLPFEVRHRDLISSAIGTFSRVPIQQMIPAIAEQGLSIPGYDSEKNTLPHKLVTLPRAGGTER
jgi:hypothetical protein